MHEFFYNGGHSRGMAVSAGGVFYPIWEDNHKVASQLWTAAVTVKGKAMRNGSPELATYNDISDSIGLTFSDYRFDRSTKRFSVNVRLVNKSTEAIRGSVKARVVRIDSPFGADLASPSIIGSENGMRGPGAVIDMSSVIPPSGLAPKDTSRPKRISLELSGIRPFKDGRFGILGYVELRILNRPSSH
jgi:hypothetical protein